MKIQQFVMAYSVEQDRLRAMLPQGFTSLRPVLRINAEICDNTGYIELNTAVQYGTKKGWLNIAHFKNVPFTQQENRTQFTTDQLNITFTAVGITGGCPAEQDNDGCYINRIWRAPETITANKEFCDCTFYWHNGNGGKSEGKTLPAIPTEPKTEYPKQPCSLESATDIPCIQVLGSYTVCFER